MAKSAPGKAERNGISLLELAQKFPTKNLQKNGWKASFGQKVDFAPTAIAKTLINVLTQRCRIGVATVVSISVSELEQ